MENNMDMQEPIKQETKVKGNVKLKQVADEMMRKEDRIWTKLNINSGSELYQNKYKQRDYFKLMRNSIDRFFGYYNFTKAEKKELESLFEDMNRHSMNNYIALKGFYTRKDQIDYINYHTKMPESFLNPANAQSSMADGGTITDSYEVFYYDADGEKHTSKPINANSEEEAISKFENDSPHVDVSYAKKIMAEGGKIDELTHFNSSFKEWNNVLQSSFPEEYKTYKLNDWHQLTNPFDVPCRIVEIQYGEDCIEEDIERK
jgi:hypothetical protein